MRKQRCIRDDNGPHPIEEYWSIRQRGGRKRSGKRRGPGRGAAKYFLQGSGRGIIQDEPLLAGGTVGTAAVKMGQGVNTKIIQVAAEDLGEGDPEKIEIEDETVFSNGEKSYISWNDLIQSAYEKRVNLSAQAHYATPGISYDAARGKGQPFGYHVIGTAITEVTLDCLRGAYEIDSVHAVHDGGNCVKSWHPGDPSVFRP